MNGILMGIVEQQFNQLNKIHTHTRTRTHKKCHAIPEFQIQKHNKNKTNNNNTAAAIVAAIGIATTTNDQRDNIFFGIYKLVLK